MERMLVPHIFCVAENSSECGILLISVRMRALYAPYMSCGSRATQAKPEALVILFRATT
jgi:hypothetical protein